MVDRPVAGLEDDDLLAAPPQFDSHRQADRPSANDQYRRLLN
jgi:hypothetical protein